MMFACIISPVKVIFEGIVLRDSCSMVGEIKTLKLKKSSSVGLRNGIYITYNVFTFLLIH